MDVQKRVKTEYIKEAVRLVRLHRNDGRVVLNTGSEAERGIARSLVWALGEALFSKPTGDTATTSLHIDRDPNGLTVEADAILLKDAQYLLEERYLQKRGI